MTFLRDLADQLDHLAAEVPRAALQQARTCVLDALACAHGGREMDWVRQARTVLPSPSGDGVTVWAAAGRRAPLLDAVYANSVASHSILHEDTHAASRVHPGTLVVPAALGVGECIGADLDDVLTATVVGYEAIAQVAAPSLGEEFVRRGWRASSVFGPVGAAAAAAYLWGLHGERLAASMALALNSASGTCQWAEDGTVEVYFQNANAARAGVHAAALARAGVTGAPRAVEGSFGLVPTFDHASPTSLPPPRVRPDRLAVSETLFKAHPSCALTQAAIDPATRLASGLDVATIERVDIHTSTAAATYPGCDNGSDLGSPIARQMSLQFTVAATLIDGRLEPERFVGDLDADLAALADRCLVRTDDAADAAFPDRLLARLEVYPLAGPPRVESSAEDVWLPPSSVPAKFLRYAGPSLGDDVELVMGALRDARPGGVTELCRMIGK